MTFKTVSAPRVFEKIASQIRDLIESENLVLGDKLPNERDLAKQFGSSRHAVREAFRALEVTGWLELRKGATGGAFVAKGRPEVFTEVVERLFQARDISVDQLTAARLIIELAIIDALAENLTEEFLARLNANVDEAERLTEAGKLAEKTAINIRFHTILSEGTDNPVLVIIMDALMAVLKRFVREFGSVMGLDVIESRRRFISCIRAGDFPGARTEMECHLKVLHSHYVEAEAGSASNLKRKETNAR